MKSVPILYYTGKFITFIIAKIVFGYKVIANQYIPSKGPFIIASNHISYFDPPLIGTASRRVCHFFAKRELFHNRIFGWVLRQVNAIPINRFGFDRNSINTVLEILNNGGGVLVFPEGTRSRNGKLREMKSGVGMLAIKSGATVIPALIENSESAKKNRLTGKKVIVTFAQPIEPDFVVNLPSGKDGYRQLTDEIARRIRLLKGEQQELKPII